MSTARFRAAAVLLASLLLLSSCATRPTAGGGRETTLLGGAVVVATKSFQPTPATALAVDTTKLAGAGTPSGNRASLLWGLVALEDY